jgi:ketosteroid isomerase-like protein
LSDENVQIVRRTFDAWYRRDLPELLELYDEDVSIMPLTGTRVESGGYRGHDGAAAYLEEIKEVWEEMRPYADDLRSSGDTVVVIGGCRVRGRESGAEADTAMAWVIRLNEGRIVSTRAFPDASAALAEAGLEDD